MRTTLLSASLVVALAACGADEPVAGRQLAELSPRSGGLATDASFAYVNDFEVTAADQTLGRQLLRAIPRTPGPSSVLYTSDATDSYPREQLALTPTHVVFADRCTVAPPAPTCARLFRIPKTGGTAELLVEDRIYDVATVGDTIYYTTSDEWGLQTGEPDGAIWKLAPGGTPELLLDGRTHLRDLDADADAVYFVDTNEDGSRARLEKLPHGETTPTLLFESTGEGGARFPLYAMDGDSIYFGYYFGALQRIAKTGGEPVVIATPPAESQAIAWAAPVGDQVIWTDPGLWVSEGDDGPSHYFRGAVMSSPKAGGGVASVFADGQFEATRVTADAAGVVWLSGGDEARPATLRTL